MTTRTVRQQVGGWVISKGPWTGLEHVEFATLEYVDWFNHRRRHGEILDWTPPVHHPSSPRGPLRTTVRGPLPAPIPRNAEAVLPTGFGC